MNTITNNTIANTNTEELNFLNLFYDTLFRPNKVAEKIKANSKTNSGLLFTYSLLILCLTSFASYAQNGNLNNIILNIFIWFLNVATLNLFAWLFRPEGLDFDSVELFYFSAFAQTPLIFLGLTQLWADSSLKLTAFTALVYLWSICLWGWAFHHALVLKAKKVFFLALLVMVGPFVLGFSIIAIFMLISFLIFTGLV